MGFALIQKKMEAPKPKQESASFRHIVRIVHTDLDGSKKIISQLRSIKGVGFMFANMVCNFSGVDKNKRTGELTDTEISALDEVIRNPAKYGAPIWMLNRRKDFEDGQNKHLLTSDLDFARDNDIKLMKKIRCYVGMRHAIGQPVRGQRTKSNFRRNKGKGLGVVKKKVEAAAAPSDKKEKK